MTIRIAIADDHPVVLEGLSNLFSREPDFEVVASARNGDQALQLVQQFAPDILVLDLRMPSKDGIAVLREMKQLGLTSKVVILTAIENEDVKKAYLGVA